MKTLLNAAAILTGVSLGAIALPTAGFAQKAATAAHPSFEGVYEPKMNFSGPRPAPPELTPTYAKIFDETKAKVAAGKLDIGGQCSPPGITFELQNLGLLEVIDGPKPSLTILYEYQSQAQRIYLDGRKMPAEVDPSPNGYSVGHWEGDTLVVETTGLSQFTFFDMVGTPHSTQMSLVTRFRKSDPKTLEAQVTVTDPLALARPYVFTRQFALVPDGTLIPFECENIRNPQNPDGSLGYTFKSNEEVERDVKARSQQ